MEKNNCDFKNLLIIKSGDEKEIKSFQSKYIITDANGKEYFDLSKIIPEPVDMKYDDLVKWRIETWGCDSGLLECVMYYLVYEDKNEVGIYFDSSDGNAMLAMYELIANEKNIHYYSINLMFYDCIDELYYNKEKNEILFNEYSFNFDCLFDKKLSGISDLTNAKNNNDRFLKIADLFGLDSETLYEIYHSVMYDGIDGEDNY